MTGTRPDPIDQNAVELAQRRLFAPAAERQASRVLGVACDPARLKIVRALQATPMAASDLARLIGKTRSATSQHLRVLREIEAVVAERKGNVVRYRLSGGTAADILADIGSAFDRLAA
jgi:DNA-binding transcriptional ArsR family regulator